MFGGGEEYFQPPPAYDKETLKHFCEFNSRLRRLEKPGKKGIAEVCALAKAVGDTLDAYELVVGTIFRHIKVWTGQRQLACWYALDRLCKESPDKYGFCASKYVLEIGRDYMPFEDPELRTKYETLVEHWENVFPRHVIDSVWMSRKERVWAAQHQEEVEAQKLAEEEEWRRTEREMQDEDGLNVFGQPCIDYLQGKCSWGDQCSLYHPPGEEGSLPPECRMGDWKCSACGVINRHFRRRCANCVREKPQYKRERKLAVEDVLLSSPDPVVLETLSQQFGYNPYEESDAVEHWKRRFEQMSVESFLSERRAAYKVRILGKKPSNALEARCQGQKNFPDPAILDSYVEDGSLLRLDSSEQALKRLRTEQLLPHGTPADKAVGILAQMLVERGVRDALAPRIYEALGASVRSVSEDDQLTLSPPTAESLLSVCALVMTAWHTDKESVPFCEAFFRGIHGVEGKLGLTPLQKDELSALIRQFV